MTDNTMPDPAAVFRRVLARPKPRYWRDWLNHRTRPLSAAAQEAFEATGRELGDAEHTAAWTVLVLASHPGRPLVTAPDSQQSMGETLAQALGGRTLDSGMAVATRFRQIHRAVALPDRPREDIADMVVRLLLSVDTQAPGTRMPDAALLYGDLVELLSGPARAGQVTHDWHQATRAAA